MQDFVIGLSVLSRLSFMEKVRVIFYLTDLDEGKHKTMKMGV